MRCGARLGRNHYCARRSRSSGRIAHPFCCFCLNQSAMAQPRCDPLTVSPMFGHWIWCADCSARGPPRVHLGPSIRSGSRLPLLSFRGSGAQGGWGNAALSVKAASYAFARAQLFRGASSPSQSGGVPAPGSLLVTQVSRACLRPAFSRPAHARLHARLPAHPPILRANPAHPTSQASGASGAPSSAPSVPGTAPQVFPRPAACACCPRLPRIQHPARRFLFLCSFEGLALPRRTQRGGVLLQPRLQRPPA